MDYHAVTHVALNTSDLRAAEAFYRALFDMAVAFREAEVADGWRTLPDEFDWDDAERAVISLGLSVLHRGNFVLALEAHEQVGADGALSHIGLAIDNVELARLRARVITLRCEILTERPDLLVFRDPFAIQWELATNYDDDPRQQSNGVRRGRWLNLKRPGAS